MSGTLSLWLDRQLSNARGTVLRVPQGFMWLWGGAARCVAGFFFWLFCVAGCVAVCVAFFLAVLLVVLLLVMVCVVVIASTLLPMLSVLRVVLLFMLPVVMVHHLCYS